MSQRPDVVDFTWDEGSTFLPPEKVRAAALAVSLNAQGRRRRAPAAQHPGAGRRRPPGHPAHRAPDVAVDAGGDPTGAVVRVTYPHCKHCSWDSEHHVETHAKPCCWVGCAGSVPEVGGLW